MFDLKAVQLLNAARITRVDYLSREQVLAAYLVRPGERLPVVLDITGERLDRTAGVLYNGEQLRFKVQAVNRVYAEVSENLVGRPIRELYVLTDTASFTSTALFSYALGPQVKLYQGYTKLLSQYLKLLMTSPGSGVFNTSVGGGLQKFAGSVQKAPHQTLALVSQTITNTAEQLRASQEGLDMPPEEKLKLVQITNLSFTKGDPTSIEAAIRVHTFGRGALDANLQFGAKTAIDQILSSSAG